LVIISFGDEEDYQYGYCPALIIDLSIKSLEPSLSPNMMFSVIVGGIVFYSHHRDRGFWFLVAGVGTITKGGNNLGPFRVRNI
jgi:hypothetical protein